MDEHKRLPTPRIPKEVRRTPPPTPLSTKPPQTTPRPADYPPCLGLNLPAHERSSQLAKLVCDPTRTLPQCVQIAKRFVAPGCRTKLETGDVLMLHFVYDNPTVYATNSMGRKLRLPIYAEQEYEILPLEPTLDDVDFMGTEALMNADPRPAVVRVVEAHCSSHPEEIQEVDDIIDIHRVEMDAERGKVLVGVSDSIPIRYSVAMDSCRYTTMISPDFHKMSELINRKFPQRVRIPDLSKGVSNRNLKNEKVLKLLKLSNEKCILATRRGDNQIYTIPVATPLIIDRLMITGKDVHDMIPPIYSLVNPTWGLVDPTQATVNSSMQAIPQPLEPILCMWLSSVEGKEKAKEVAEIRTQNLQETLRVANEERRQMKLELDFFKNETLKFKDRSTPLRPPRTKKENEDKQEEASKLPPKLPPRPLCLRRDSKSQIEEVSDPDSDTDYEDVENVTKGSMTVSPKAITQNVNEILSKKEMELADLKRKFARLQQRCENLQKENQHLQEASTMAGPYEEIKESTQRLYSTTFPRHNYNRGECDREYLEPIKFPSPPAVTFPREKTWSLRDLERLTVSEVGTFLRHHGLQHYEEVFASNSVDGRMLIAMTDDRMKDLTMTRLHARKLKIEIDKIRRGSL